MQVVVYIGLNILLSVDGALQRNHPASSEKVLVLQPTIGIHVSTDPSSSVVVGARALGCVTMSLSPADWVMCAWDAVPSSSPVCSRDDDSAYGSTWTFMRDIKLCTSAPGYLWPRTDVQSVE
eukprot:TRINITY_DN34226_c0_g1_i1.p2 TRINITY_DN34226_c0_g1~~TRINITY_DN34226_c0_g1_i1.p2  ORF type:complete len:122 (+),score=0.96 TRINITY_DN34226_c0_g1_i1:1018-1383(+)